MTNCKGNNAKSASRLLVAWRCSIRSLISTVLTMFIVWNKFQRKHNVYSKQFVHYQPPYSCILMPYMSTHYHYFWIFPTVYNFYLLSIYLRGCWLTPCRTCNLEPCNNVIYFQHVKIVDLLIYRLIPNHIKYIIYQHKVNLDSPAAHHLQFITGI